MTDLINNLKSSTKSSANRSSYSLTEVVGILFLIQDGKSKKEIAELTGRSAHSLQYKFYEGEVQMAQKDGTVKSVIRSVRKYESIEALYADHNAPYSKEDQDARIEEFLNNLTKQPITA